MGQKSRLRQLNRLLNKVKEHFPEMAAKTDKELSDVTAQLKSRLAAGEDLDALLPCAFAAVCEADERILGMRPFDVQILGGIALHKGYLAEMNTGEGKTLTATMPLYLNALTGKSTILVTANEYLAIRDAEEMGKMYSFMGLSVVAGVTEKKEKFTNDEKREIYSKDIVYTTHGALGFDYLFNNLVNSATDRFLRDFYFCIIDEADSVLLDAAQMPLVISGSPRVQSNLYELADFFISTLKRDVDYEVEDKKVWFTAAGIEKAEGFFRIDNFYGEEYFEINRHVTLALRAHVLYEKEEDYVVSEEGEIVLLDSGSGRMVPGVKMRGGQHQALEAKEKIEISQESRSVASITYQNLFLLFPVMSGMSGTISDAEEELRNVYGKEVVIIPPHVPVNRIDLPDRVFANTAHQFKAAIGMALLSHDKGQPVLIVASTIKETEFISSVLLEQKVPHNVLNANNAFWEAQIIKEAGKKGAVTVATSMAGRGTDIKLGEGVAKLGGLAVIGVGRMPNVRIERQARGRSGRQGDPGYSCFFVSPEDEIVKRNGGATVKKLAKRRKTPCDRTLKRIVNKAQKVGEEQAVLSRKQAVDYDKVMLYQRELMYETRDNLLDGGTVGLATLIEIAKSNVNDFLDNENYEDRHVLSRYILDNISYGHDESFSELETENKEEVSTYLIKRFREGLRRQKGELPTEKDFKDFVRLASLTAIDEAWVEQVDYLQQLQAAVGVRSLAQRNPVYEYQKEAFESFEKMKKTIYRNIIRNILLSEVSFDEEEKMKILFP